MLIISYWPYFSYWEKSPLLSLREYSEKIERALKSLANDNYLDFSHLWQDQRGRLPRIIGIITTRQRETPKFHRAGNDNYSEDDVFTPDNIVAAIVTNFWSQMNRHTFWTPEGFLAIWVKEFSQRELMGILYKLLEIFLRENIGWKISKKIEASLGIIELEKVLRNPSLTWEIWEKIKGRITIENVVDVSWRIERARIIFLIFEEKVFKKLFTIDEGKIII